MEAKNNELFILDEPTNYMKEVSNINFEKWLEDMKFQMDSMYTNQLQTLVDPSDMIKPMGYKLVCKKENDKDGNVCTKLDQLSNVKNKDKRLNLIKISHWWLY